MASSWICHQQYLHGFILSAVFSDKMSILSGVFKCFCKLSGIIPVKGQRFFGYLCKEIFDPAKRQKILHKFSQLCQYNDPLFLWILFEKVILKVLRKHLSNLSFQRIERLAKLSQGVLCIKQILTLLAIIL